MVEPSRTPFLPVAVLMVPFALATWAVDRVDGAVGTLVLGWTVLVVAGGALGCWLVGAHRASRPSWTPAVVLALVPTLLIWLAWSASDRPEIEAMSADLESTGVPPFRVEVAGYDLGRVHPGTATPTPGPASPTGCGPRTTPCATS